MGACASAPITGVELKGRSCPQNEFRATRAPPSRRHLVNSPDDGRRSKADTIATAFVAQVASDADFDPARALSTRLASRNQALDGRRASAQAYQLGIASAPAAESIRGLQAFRGDDPAGGAVYELAPDPGDGPDTAEQSFEMARAETARRLEALQKGFRSGTGKGTAWCTPESKRGGVADTADRGPGGGPGGGAATERVAARGAPGTAAGADAAGTCGDGDGDARWPEYAEDGEEEGAGEELVVPVGEDVGGDGRRGSTDTAGLKAAPQKPAAGDAGGGADAYKESCDEDTGTPCRLDRSAASAVHVRQFAKDQASTCAAAAAAASAAEGAAAASGGDAAAHSCEPETDELTNLPLPNLVNVNTGGGGPSMRLRAGHRYSGASYVVQQRSGSLQGVLEAGVSGHANRNSDLGFYQDEARLSAASASSPLRGAQPIRHHILDSPLARLRAEQAAKEAEAGRPPVQVLDYVPAIRSQASRSNLLLAPPSKKVRQQSLSCAYDLGAGEIEVDESEDSDGASRRLEYRPMKSSSRRQLQLQRSAGMPSAAAPLLSSPSRLTSPAHLVSPSRLVSPSGSSLLGPMCPTRASSTAHQSLAGDSSRCFYVTTPGMHDAGGARAATASGGLPATASGVGLAAAAFPAAMPVMLATGSTTAAAAAPMTPPRTRTAKRLVGADPRVTAFTSQVHFGPVEMLVMESPSPQHLASAVTASSELSPRPRRSVGLTAFGAAAGSASRLAENRPSAPLLQLVPSRLQQPSQNDDGRGVGRGGGGDGGGKGGGGHGGARRRAQEALSGTAWSDPSAFLSAPAPAAAAGDGAGGGGVLGSGSEGAGSRAANRAARLLATLHRLGVVTPEQPSTAA